MYENFDLSLFRVFGASMGGTGEQAMVSEEEKESHAYFDLSEEPTFRHDHQGTKDLSH